MALSRLGNIKPTAYIVILLAFAASVLFYKNNKAGYMPGVLIGCQFFYSYYQNDLRKIDIRPFAVVVIIYYILLGLYVKKGK